MKFKVLRMQVSLKPLSETQLCLEGIIKLETSDLAQSFEMVLEYYDGDDCPYKIIDVHKNHYVSFIDDYGIEALIEGVKVDFLSDILDNKENVKYILQKEAEKISYLIIAQFEKDTLFNQYNPGKLRDYIENKIIELTEKFKIESK